MTYTYYADVRCLDNETLFREKVKLLSPYRQQKIAILRHEKDKNRSLAAGLLLDHALAAFGLQERSVEYEIGEWGKPALKYHPEICFSLSHSGDYAICTIGDKPVGNDIERERDGRLKVANRFFAKEELLWLYEAGGGGADTADVPPLDDEGEFCESDRQGNVFIPAGFCDPYGRGIGTCQGAAQRGRKILPYEGIP